MPQRQLPIDETELHIETPVINMQDLEHNSTPQTRVPNKGVKIEPTIDTDEAALEALEDFKQRIRQQPPS